MRPSGRAAASLRFLLLSLSWALALAEGDQPEVAVSEFDRPPINLNYFEDSDIVIFHDFEGRAIYRSDNAGAKWSLVTDLPERAIGFLVMHPYEPKTAFAMTLTDKHFKTTDQGKTWKDFNSGSLPSEYQPQTLAFHADDPNRIIFNGMKCDGIFCEEEATYTLDGFKTVKPLRSLTAGCHWAKSTEEFASGDKDKDKNRILCTILDKVSIFQEDQRLVMSDAFFAEEDSTIQEFEPFLDGNKAVDGVVNLATVKKYILVATKSYNSDEMALYITSDTVHWHRAVFPADDSHDHSHQINQDAYTILESTNYSIQVDVQTSHPSDPMGVLFTSNSNGTYFTENVPYTNRNLKGHVDFEKMSSIQGIIMVNVVKNGKEVDSAGADKNIISQISFDDGRTFEQIKAGDENIHLHSITQLDNIGRVFSSPAPGLVMGNGNTGASLGKFKDSNLYVSDNAGVTWQKALDGPHKYEFGDSGSILVAVKDSLEPNVDSLSYSFNHGKDWDSVKFPDGLKIKPDFLTTVQDSTSLKFLLLGEKEEKYHFIYLDFGKIKKRKCTKDDMEDWHARVDKDGKPTCIMGHKQSFTRRKKDADCFVQNEFHDVEPKTDDCECTDADFECDFNFSRDLEDRSVCKQAGPVIVPDGACKGGTGKFKGSSGWRLIPGNTCKRQKGEQKDDPKEWDCSDGGKGGGGDGDGDKGGKGGDKSPGSGGDGKVSHTKVDLDTKLKDFQKFYLDRGDSSAGTDETIIVRPAEYGPGGVITKVENVFWRTTDHGKNWKQILEGEDIKGVYTHDYFKDVIFFTTTTLKVIYTIDRGQSFHSFEAPSKTTASKALEFHPDKKDWLIWVGEDCEKVGKEEECMQKASISTDRGDHWETLLRYAEKCEFTGHSAYKFRPLKQVVCLAPRDEKADGELTVVTIDDFSDEEKTFHEGVVNHVATMSEFILATQKNKDGGLEAMASLDGKTFEPAHWPFNFKNDEQNAYTVLDSSTHAINLFVATDTTPGSTRGSVMKSNSNGTQYVVSAANVNCDEQFYVDFERVAGLEGVSLINVVANPDDKKAKAKKIQSKISHNDGAEWGFLPPPSKNVDGKGFKCSSSTGDEGCALHLHHYTERDDTRRTFGALSAVGLMFGVGNVGSELDDIEKADTFMTADGGVSWMNVKKGHWTWQFGDQGSIIVLVERATHGNGAKTKEVSYSLDEGRNWATYAFSEEEVTVLDITTVQGGSSRNFLLWCKSSGGKMFTVNLDFSGTTDKECEYVEGEENGKSDYYLWSPKHPLQSDDCMFGHIAQYLRKKSDRQCYNSQKLKRLHDYADCECSRRDYECDYNYELDNHGQCSLVEGFEPLSGAKWCEMNPNATSWFEPTGYRRLPLTTCNGGYELDKTSTEHACDGYEDEFEKKHGTSGVAIFFAVVLPFAAAGAIGWYVWRNWGSKLGQIRLGDNSSTFDSDRPWIRYPVIAVSALAAVVAALPLVATSLWRTASGTYERVRGSRGQGWNRRFTTRDSFARGRGDYAVVDDDEGELLGDESDEEV